MTLQPEEVPPQIAAMHKEYERLTGGPLTLNWTRLDAWRIFLKFRTPPFTAQDLRTVVDYIRKGIKSGKRNPGALKFSNLIQSVDFFEEDLALAVQEKRPRRPSTKSITEGGFQKIVEDHGTDCAVVSVDDVIAAMRRAAG